MTTTNQTTATRTDENEILQAATDLLNEIAADEGEPRATQLAAVRAVEQIDKIVQRWRRDEIAARRAAIKAKDAGAGAGNGEAR